MGKVFTSTLEQTARLLDLVPFIATHQEISLTDLSANFGISKRDLLDDLNTLWMCGLPGYTPLELIDLTFDEGFVSIRNSEILETPRSLTTEEVIVLILGLDLLSKSKTTLTNEIGRLQAKLRAISGDIARALPTVDSAHRAILEKAIGERKSVVLHYFSPVADKISARLVSPLELQSEARGEYLIAMTESGLRTFKLDRVSEVEIQSQAPNNNLNRAVEDGSEIEVEIRILENLRANAERFNVEPSHFASDPKSAIRATGFSSEWFVRAAMASAGDVEIVQPTHIRTEVAKRSAALLAMYSSGILPI
jgi:proteasome accessory factor C